VKLREMESRLVKQLDALERVSTSSEWSTLREEIFDSLVESLNKRLLTEAKKTEPDARYLNRLSGQLEWAARYADLSKFREEKRVELTNIRKRLHGKYE
jgi:hypothetical protein